MNLAERIEAADLIRPVPTGPPISATRYRWRDPATLPQLPWVFGRYFLRGVVTAVVSPGGVGKTTLLAGTALSVVSGRALLGKVPWNGQGRVWIWNFEDDLDQLSRVIQAGALHFKLDEADLGASYEELDRILALLVDARVTPATIVAKGFPRKTVDRVTRLVGRSQFKRRPPLIAKVSTRSIGWDFRYPRDWNS